MPPDASAVVGGPWFDTHMQRLLVAVLALGIVVLPGCLFSNTISGSWQIGTADGCRPGDDVYVTESKGYGNGAETAEHFACDDGGFAFTIPASTHEFRLDLLASGRDDFFGSAHLSVEHVTGDFDVGLVQFSAE